jgi:hypothetical protein
MQRPLTIELPEETHATTLRGQLEPFDVDAVAVDGHWELRIRLVDQNPESRIVTALHAIDAWLVGAGVDSIRIHLDGSSYTLHAPPAAKQPVA